MGVGLQLLAMVGSVVATIGYVAYRVGKLEGTIVATLEVHERRIQDVERRLSQLHVSV